MDRGWFSRGSALLEQTDAQLQALTNLGNSWVYFALLLFHFFFHLVLSSFIYFSYSIIFVTTVGFKRRCRAAIIFTTALLFLEARGGLYG